MGDKKREYQHSEEFAKAEAECDTSSKLSPGGARGKIITAWDNGHIHITAHFKARASQRGFDVIDAENVVRDGKMCGDGEYCPDFKSWKYIFQGKVEEETLEIVVSINPSNDYSDPVVAVITGYWRASNKGTQSL